MYVWSVTHILLSLLPLLCGHFLSLGLLLKSWFRWEHGLITRIGNSVSLPLLKPQNCCSLILRRNYEENDVGWPVSLESQFPPQNWLCLQISWLPAVAKQLMISNPEYLSVDHAIPTQPHPGLGWPELICAVRWAVWGRSAGGSGAAEGARAGRSRRV